jgi:hypothetical protein
VLSQCSPNLCSPKILLPPDNIGVFLNTLLKWVLDIADNDLQRTSALHIVASVVNRRAEGAPVLVFENSFLAYTLQICRHS